jgi:hypothetical protein
MTQTKSPVRDNTEKENDPMDEYAMEPTTTTTATEPEGTTINAPEPKPVTVTEAGPDDEQLVA